LINIERCPLCESKNINIIKEHIYYKPEEIINENRNIRNRIVFNHFIKGENDAIFYIMKCSHCNFIFMNPRMTEEEVKIKYRIIGEERDPKFHKRKHLNSVQIMRKKRIKKIVNKLKVRTLLDYGGSNGNMLINLKDSIECDILDFERFELPKKINYAGKDFNDIEGKKYDVVLLLHTLEHIISPVEFLKKLREYNKKYLIVEVPIGAGIRNEWENQKGSIGDPITHINFFDMDTLITAITKAGYEIIEKIKNTTGLGRALYVLARRL
jgi:hypothetical protein